MPLLCAPPALAQNSVSLVSASGFGNFHAGGVVVTIAGDANRNAAVALEWRPSGGMFRPGHPLSRIDTVHFAGSLFGLSPGTAYEARVTLSDPDGVTGPPSAVAAVPTRADVQPEPSLRTLYVSPAGSDTNAGTSAGAPLRTVQRAADLAQAGDLVLAQPGVYRESVSVPRSGTAGQPIVFRGNGPGAVLDGADAAIAAGVAWTSSGAGVYFVTTGFATGHVVTEAGRLYRYGSVAELQALAAGPPGGFHFDGTRLHVKLADGSSPASHVLHVARLEDGFLLDGRSFVRVENLEIRHYGAGDYGKGVYLRNATDCTVKACRIHEVGSAGVWVKGGDRNLVEDNTIWDTSIFGWPWGSTKGSSAENNGIVFTDAVGRGNVVRRNTVHGTFNGMGPCGSTAPAGVTNETDLYDNVLYEHTDDGLEPEGYCANVRIWGNRIRDVHMAVAVAPAAPGPVYLVRNVAWRFGNTRTSKADGYTASALKVNSGYPTPIGPLFLYHNTFLTDAPATDAIALLNPGSGTIIRARNNVIGGTRYALYKVNPVPWDGDGDDVHTTDASRLVWWQGTRYDTLAAFRGIGQEPQGLSAPPLLADPAGGDFEPQAGSALVDRGVLLPGVNDGSLGAGPDVGAIETDGLPGLRVGDVTVVEGNVGTVAVRFTVTLSAASGQAVTASWATANGTALAGSDYVAASGVLDFPPGTVERTVDVAVTGDIAVEAGETFFLDVSSPSDAALADGRGQATILNDDLRPIEFNGDGKPDLLWHHQVTGDLYTWLMNGTVAAAGSYLTPSRFADTRWQIRGLADFNGDGKTDVLWHHQVTGDLYVWMLNGTVTTNGAYLNPSSFADTRWQIRGVVDLNGDGQADLLWHHQVTGDLYVWFMGGTVVTSGSYLTPSRFADTRWQIRGVVDLDADGRPDVLWHHQATGELYVWFMSGTVVTSGSYLTPSRFADTGWKIVATPDLDADGRPDLLWHHQGTGDLYVWFLDGTVTRAGSYLTPSRFADTSWKIVPR